MNLPIYMDGHATTRVDPRVIAAMVPFFGEYYGNAASRHHQFGWVARDAVVESRLAVARLIGATSREVVFTSGATESNNLALKGVMDASRARGNHIVTACTEHRAILDPCARLEQQGVAVSYLPVRGDGLLDVGTALVSVMLAHNEIGVLQPIGDLARVAHSGGALFHTDAAQAVGQVKIDVSEDGIDLLSMTAHKLYGPKGIGALYVRRGLTLTPLVDGGGHESGLRSGTLNVPAIVGLGHAARLCMAEMSEEAERLTQLRNRLWHGLQQALPGVSVNGSMTSRLPHNLNVTFDGVDGEQLLIGLDDVAVSSGAACSSSRRSPSHVLTALGLREAAAQASIRFGLGRFNTDEDINYVVEKLRDLVARLRAPVPVFEIEDDAPELPPGWAAAPDRPNRGA